MLSSVLKQWPIETVKGASIIFVWPDCQVQAPTTTKTTFLLLLPGLPVLQPSLRWSHACPVYVMGPYAQLQLGPDALNLAGSRSGSCRIDTAIRGIVRGGAQEAVEIDKIGVKLTNSGWASVNLKFRK